MGCAFLVLLPCFWLDGTFACLTQKASDSNAAAGSASLPGDQLLLFCSFDIPL